jgi:hypothetical protein
VWAFRRLEGIGRPFRTADTLPHLRESTTRFFGHHMAESRMVRAVHSEVRIGLALVCAFTFGRPFRTLLGRVGPPENGASSPNRLTPGRPVARIGAAYRISGVQIKPMGPIPPSGQIQKRLAFLPQIRNPVDLGAAQIRRTVSPIQNIRNHLVVVLVSQPVVERCLPPERATLMCSRKRIGAGFVVSPIYR